MKMHLINKLSDNSLRYRERHKGFLPFLSALCTEGAMVNTGAPRPVRAGLLQSFAAPAFLH